MRRPLLVTTTALAAAAALTGCAIGTPSSPATVTVTAPAAAPEEDAPEEAVVEAVPADVETDAAPMDEEEEEAPSDGIDLFADNSVEDSAVPLGTERPVGDYRVTVVDANLDATDEAMGGNSFNEAPENGVYAIFSLHVEYNGDTEGSPGFDLSLHVNGTDGVQYADYDCGATLENGAYDAPTLNAGGEADYFVCVDAPAEALSEGATFAVEDSLSFSGAAPQEWALR